jgi:peptide deformylase
MEVVVPEIYRHLYEVSEQRPVVKIPADVLRQKAKEISRITPRHRVLADNMARIMRQANGVGLAAPQIGVAERVIVVSPDHRPIVLFNPEITESEGEQVGEEGCLSIPGLYGDVTRAKKVKVRAMNRKGDTISLVFEYLGARIVQHEIDHLEGVLFIDKVDASTLYWKDPEKDED